MIPLAQVNGPSGFEFQDGTGVVCTIMPTWVYNPITEKTEASGITVDQNIDGIEKIKTYQFSG